MISLKRFTEKYGKSRLARDAYFYYVFISSQNNKHLTRAEIYEATGLNVHRQLQIETLLGDEIDKENDGRGYFFRLNDRGSLFRIRTSQLKERRRLPNRSSVVIQSPHYYVDNGMQISTNQPLLILTPEQESDFSFEPIENDMWKVTSRKYPDLEITITNEQYLIAKESPKLLEFKFDTLAYKKTKEQLNPPNPFQKYLDRLEKMEEKDCDIQQGRYVENDKSLQNFENFDKRDNIYIFSNTPTFTLVEEERKEEERKEKEKEKEKKEEEKKEESLAKVEGLESEQHENTDLVKPPKKEKLIRGQPASEIIKEAIGKWNELASKIGLSKVVKITERRQQAILKRFSEPEFDYDQILHKIENSDFLRGIKTEWRVDFDFVFLSAHNYVKILEGKYDNRAPQLKGQYSDFNAKLAAIADNFRREQDARIAQRQHNATNKRDNNV